jgi:SAM-dependent methyltransferase
MTDSSTDTRPYQDTLLTAYEARSGDRQARKPTAFKVEERDHFRHWLHREERNSVIEIGCGPGHDAEAFTDAGLRVRATDVTPAMVQLAKQKGIDAEVLDVYDLASHDGRYDAAYSMNCLLHVPNSHIDSVLGGIQSVLADGGLFYLGTWGGNDFEGIWEQDSYDPSRFFSFRSARTLLSQVQQRFRIDYYRRFEAEATGFEFHSLILRNCAEAESTTAPQ